jgi:hypothetical protein
MIIGNILLLILTTKKTAYFLVICISLSFWGTLLVLHQTLKTILAQLEPLLDLVEILEEIHGW